MSTGINPSDKNPEIVLPTTNVIEVVGKTGRKGEQGNTGPKGDIGPKGEEGKLGEPGVPGKDGKDADLQEVEDLIDKKAESLEEMIKEISSDGYVTPSEKRVLQVEINSIIAEKELIISQANLHQLVSLRTAYLNAYDALLIYMQPILSDPTTTTKINPESFNSIFSTFYTARAALLKKIAENDFDNISQARATLEGVEKITNFWKITLDDESGIIAAGTMLVGTANYNNAGMTGVTDAGEDSVRFFAGAAYQNKNMAPYRILNNGKVWIGNERYGFDYGITEENRLTIRGGLSVDAGGNTSELDVYRGLYQGSTTYYKGNTVTYDGSLWRYINDLPGNGGIPSVTVPPHLFWLLVTSKGEDGTDGSDGVATEYRYRVTGSWSTPPPAPAPADPDPSGWTIKPPTFTVGQYLWKIINTRKGDGTLTSTWSGPYLDTGIPGAEGARGPQGEKGQVAFKSIVFMKSLTKPAVPTGGSFANPVPSGWSDGVPGSTNYPVWATERIFTSDGLAPQEATWGPVNPMADTVDIDYEWSSVALTGNPGNPTTNPENWYNTPVPASNWRATQRRVLGVWQNWVIEQIKGETGAKGDKGDTGIPGPPGADGAPTYTWIKYANTPTSGMVDVWVAGKEYIGIAYNKPSPTASTNYGDYIWSKFQGNQGVKGDPGAKGDPGNSNYTWIKYADSPLGAGMSDSPEGKTYIGLAFNKTTPVESNVASDYSWSLMQGAQGPRGPYLVDRGIWTNTDQYQGSAAMLQIVEYAGRGYLTRSDAGNIPIGTLPTDTSKWEVFQTNFESVYTKLLVALSANIGNLVIGQLSSNNGLISLNLNQDNALKIRHDVPGLPEGIVIRTNPNTGQPEIQAKNAEGVLIWDLTMAGLKQYVTIIPASWTKLKFLRLSITAENPTEEQINTMRTEANVAVCQSNQPNMFGIVGSYTAFAYFAGQNEDSDAKKIYEGLHTAQTESTSNWIPDGWYIQAGYKQQSMDNPPNNLVTAVDFYQEGKFVKNIRLEGISQSSNAGACPINFNN